MLNPDLIARLRTQWEAAGRPNPWMAPRHLHREYERALMHTEGRFVHLLVSFGSFGSAWMQPEDVPPEMRLPEGF